LIENIELIEEGWLVDADADDHDDDYDDASMIHPSEVFFLQFSIQLYLFVYP